MVIIELLIIWILVAAALWIHACVKYVQARKVRNEKSSERVKWQRAVRKMLEDGTVRYMPRDKTITSPGGKTYYVREPI